jgi:hypothetical protein
METVTTSEFKAKCPSLLEQIKRRKSPCVSLCTGTDRVRTSSVAGMHYGLVWVMRDKVQILGDIISPASEEGEWDVLRD